MKRFKLFGTGALAVCALSLAVLPVSSASAAKSVLQLDEGATRAANEAPSFLTIEIDGCFSRDHGHLTGNDLATVTAVTTESEGECGIEGSSIAGSIEKAAVTSKGKFTLTGSLTVTEREDEPTGPCTYLFSKWKLKTTVPGPVEFSGTVAGKLDKAFSNNKDCAKKVEEEAVIRLRELTDGAPFEAVLVP
jgi:hypothetical protein